mmetsp:Transcript_94221/g.236432  ORF Transcript_94221/g.236432 Transcript_94221/m.236432 type:complete len:231 (-) Transcript_94221:1112-1804(-)
MVICLELFQTDIPHRSFNPQRTSLLHKAACRFFPRCCKPLYTSPEARTRCSKATSKCLAVTGGTSASESARCTPPGSSRSTSKYACCANLATSSPDMPSVRPATSASCSSVSSARWPSRVAPLTRLCNKSCLCAVSGRPTSASSPKRLNAASSKASARFVAPIKKTRSAPWSKPSIHVNKALVTPLWCSATPAPPSRFPRRVSTSSKNTIAGLCSCANSSKAEIRFCESP